MPRVLPAHLLATKRVWTRECCCFSVNLFPIILVYSTIINWCSLIKLSLPYPWKLTWHVKNTFCSLIALILSPSSQSSKGEACLASCVLPAPAELTAGKTKRGEVEARASRIEQWTLPYTSQLLESKWLLSTPVLKARFWGVVYTEKERGQQASLMLGWCQNTLKRTGTRLKHYLLFQISPPPK